LHSKPCTAIKPPTLICHGLSTRYQGSKKRFFKKSPTHWVLGFYLVFGQAGKIGKINISSKTYSLPLTTVAGG